MQNGFVNNRKMTHRLLVKSAFVFVSLLRRIAESERESKAADLWSSTAKEITCKRFREPRTHVN